MRGNSRPEFLMAEVTRSLASWTAVSPSPTMLKAGRPGRMSVSTSIRWALRPFKAAEKILEGIGVG